MSITSVFSNKNNLLAMAALAQAVIDHNERPRQSSHKGKLPLTVWQKKCRKRRIASRSRAINR